MLAALSPARRRRRWSTATTRTWTSAGHQLGVDSPQWRDAAAERRPAARPRWSPGCRRDAALLVTADHGQLDVPADRRFDMAADPRLRPGVAVVAGEPRVRYLHTAPGARDDVLAAWRAVLGDAAWVVTREEAIAAGWFGPVPRRAPAAGSATWW